MVVAFAERQQCDDNAPGPRALEASRYPALVSGGDHNRESRHRDGWACIESGPWDAICETNKSSRHVRTPVRPASQTIRVCRPERMERCVEMRCSHKKGRPAGLFDLHIQAALVRRYRDFNMAKKKKSQLEAWCWYCE